MDKWFNTVQAQLYFAQGAIERLLVLEASGKNNQSYKQVMNESILVTRELWFVWLNEWSEYLAPKREVGRVERFHNFVEMFPNAPEVQGITSSIASGEHWVQSFIELETLSSREWLSQIDKQKVEANDAAEENGGMIVIARARARRLSVLNGAEDLREMILGLKDFMKAVRAQHTEW